MNLPTEYVLRNDRIRSMLRFPCSLFLAHTKKHVGEPLKSKTILTLFKNDNSEDNTRVRIWVCRYDLDRFKPGEVPSPISECYISFDDLFNSEFVIIPEYKPIPFEESPYDFYGKQDTSMPNGILQEKEYVNALDNFFISKKNRQNREQWLWNAFKSLNVGSDLRSKFFGPMTCEQDLVKTASTMTCKFWETWKSMFLFNDVPAPELIFNKSFKMPDPVGPTYDPEVLNSNAIFSPNIDPFFQELIGSTSTRISRRRVTGR